MEGKQSTVSESETESNSPPAVSRATAAQAVSVALSLGNAGTTEAATPGNVDSLAKMKGKMPEKRPREYDAEGNLILSSAGGQPPEEQLGTTPFSSSSSSSKRGRGRPPAGDRQRLESIGKESKSSAAGIFKPLVLTVKTGEGQFEILTLSWPLSVIDDVTPSALSISLAGPDGHVIAGITDSLTAADSIQLVLGSFIPNGNEEHKRKQRGEHALASPPLPANPDTVIAAIPILQREDGGIQPGLTLTPPSLLPQTLTEATRMSQAKPDVIQPGLEWLRGHTAGRDNQIGPSHFAGWNGSEARPDRGQFPRNNVPFPVIAAIPISQREAGSIQPGLTLRPPSSWPQTHVEPRPPAPAVPYTLTEATRMSQAKPDVIQPGLEWLRGHTAGRDNQIGRSHFAGGNSSEARPDRGQFPHNNDPFPALIREGELFAAIAGGDVKAYVVTVAPGENIESKLHSLAQKGPGGICVLSATGTVSEAEIYEPVASGNFERFYQARFEILYLSGCYAIDDALTWRGEMSVVLSAPDGSYFANACGENLQAKSAAAPYALTASTPISQPKSAVIQAGLPQTPPTLPPRTQVEPKKNTTAE
ncbi:hypothetical protein L484_012799 [Morus notabilis]|uniref:AT-hook motif nuclear-localized protein n=1 Tax=Morus notabilis TaxID=981085 RepID=W9SIX4_9ROSA|nr:hypothetical protein L484_012799 [Morus notabilis]